MSTTDELIISIRDHDDPAALLTPEPDITRNTREIYLLLNPKTESVGVTTLRQVVLNSTPVEVYHGRRYRIRLPDQTDASRLKAWVEERASLIRRIFAGHSVEWDGSNHVGRLTEDAKEAKDRLLALVQPGRPHPSNALRDRNQVLPDRDFEEVGRREVDVPTHDIALWEASEWVYPAKKEVIRDYDITPELPDERVEEIARELEEEARAQGEVKLHSTEEAVRMLMEEAGEL